MHYQGFRDDDGDTRVSVFRGGRERPLDARLDLRAHSPTGLNWGYGGSGPAQLSLALLADFFGSCGIGDAVALALYQLFKFRCIATITGDDWLLDEETVRLELSRIIIDDVTHTAACLRRAIEGLEGDR